MSLLRQNITSRLSHASNGRELVKSSSYVTRLPAVNVGFDSIAAGQIGLSPCICVRFNQVATVQFSSATSICGTIFLSGETFSVPLHFAHDATTA